MINNEFIGYLRLVVSPEVGQVYMDAYSVLTQTGSTQHEFAITSFIHTADDNDTAVTVGLIEQCLVSTLADRLGEHGISLAEISLPHMTIMLDAMVGVDYYGDPTTLYNITNSDANAEIKLCELLELFGPYDWIDYTPFIASVKPELMTSINALLADRVADALAIEAEELEPVLVLPLVDIRSRVLAYTAGRGTLQLLRLIRDGMPLGLDLELYVEVTVDDLRHVPIPMVVSELVAMALASNLLMVDIKSAIKEQIESLYAEANILTLAMIALDKEDFTHE